MNDNIQSKTNNTMFFLFCVLGIIAIWILLPNLVYAIMAYRFEDGKIPDGVGISGDFFGSVNALFAGLAFLLILISVRQGQKNLESQREALLAQQEELRLQREELIESRKVMKEQASAQNDMIKAIQGLAKDTRYNARIQAQSAILQVSGSASETKQELQKLSLLINQRPK